MLRINKLAQPTTNHASNYAWCTFYEIINSSHVYRLSEKIVHGPKGVILEIQVHLCSSEVCQTDPILILPIASIDELHLLDKIWTNYESYVTHCERYGYGCVPEERFALLYNNNPTLLTDWAITLGNVESRHQNAEEFLAPLCQLV